MYFFVFAKHTNFDKKHFCIFRLQTTLKSYVYFGLLNIQLAGVQINIYLGKKHAGYNNLTNLVDVQFCIFDIFANLIHPDFCKVKFAYLLNMHLLILQNFICIAECSLACAI